MPDISNEAALHLAHKMFGHVKGKHNKRTCTRSWFSGHHCVRGSVVEEAWIK